MSVLTVESTLFHAPTTMIRVKQDLAKLIALREKLDFAEVGVGMKDLLLGLFLVLFPHCMFTRTDYFHSLLGIMPCWAWGMCLITCGIIRTVGTKSQSIWMRSIGSFWACIIWCKFAWNSYGQADMSIGFAFAASLLGINLVIWLRRKDWVRQYNALSKDA